MSESTGRRAANHAATHAAITRAARRLFARQGFEATSVRQIADAAGIGERTFYRYFDGKEALLSGEIETWLTRLTEVIAAQPEQTPMLTVVRDALSELLGDTAGRGPEIGWLLSSQPRPLELLRRSAPRPIRRFERAIEAALCARLAAAEAAELSLQCDLTARVCVSVVRSAAVRARDASEGPSEARPFSALVDEGFTALEQVLARDEPTAAARRRSARPG